MLFYTKKPASAAQIYPLKNNFLKNYFHKICTQPSLTKIIPRKISRKILVKYVFFLSLQAPQGRETLHFSILSAKTLNHFVKIFIFVKLQILSLLLIFIKFEGQIIFCNQIWTAGRAQESWDEKSFQTKFGSKGKGQTVKKII